MIAGCQGVCSTMGIFNRAASGVKTYIISERNRDAVCNKTLRVNIIRFPVMSEIVIYLSERTCPFVNSLILVTFVKSQSNNFTQFDPSSGLSL